jgi:hypothetical protein
MTTALDARTAVGLRSEHRRWLVANAIIIPIFANAVLNGAIAWVTSLGERAVPLLSIPLIQKPSTHTLGTLVVLPFVTTLLVTVSVRREQQLGRLAPLKLQSRLVQWLNHEWLNHVPTKLLRHAGRFALICLVLLGPLSIVALVASDFGGITPSSFVLYKVIFGVCLGIVVTPLIALAAMAEPR